MIAEAMLRGGIDLGGTKIEARLFEGPEARTVETRRIPTPKESFGAMMEALEAQISWLEGHATGLPVGVAVPGLIDPLTQENFASNIPATGHSVARTLAQSFGRPVPVVNDCMAFAYSEAHGGAADGARVVMGLILGTGVGGGLCIDGQVPPRHAGLAIEIGHLGLSGRALERHGLPLWRCGCGRRGCMENYVSGTGLANLAEWHLGERLPAEEIARAQTPGTERVMTIWEDLAGECLDAIQLLFDPDCIVIGGGLSRIAGVTERLSASLGQLRLGRARAPRITVALHGDSSGARGAALLAGEAK